MTNLRTRDNGVAVTPMRLQYQGIRQHTMPGINVCYVRRELRALSRLAQRTR